MLPALVLTHTQYHIDVPFVITFKWEQATCIHMRVGPFLKVFTEVVCAEVMAYTNSTCCHTVYNQEHSVMYGYHLWSIMQHAWSSARVGSYAASDDQ